MDCGFRRSGPQAGTILCTLLRLERGTGIIGLESIDLARLNDDISISHWHRSSESSIICFYNMVFFRYLVSSTSRGERQIFSFRIPPRAQQYLPITLRHALQLILLLNRIAVAASFGRIDQLLCQTFSHALDIPESRLAGTNCEESDRLVDTAQGRDVDGLTADGTC